MAQANRFTGKEMVITFNTVDENDDPVAVTLEADFKTLAVKESVNSAEATAGADGHEYSIPTYAASTIDVETLGVKQADNEYDNIQTYIQEGVFGELVYSPEGDAEYAPRFTADGYIESAEIEYPFDDVVSVKFTFKCNAAIVVDAWPDL